MFSTEHLLRTYFLARLGEVLPAVSSFIAVHGGTLFGLLLLRAAPVMVYVLCARRFGPLAKLVVLIAVPVLLLLVQAHDPWAHELTCYGPLICSYFFIATVVSAVICRLNEILSKFSSVLAFAVLFVFVPALSITVSGF